MTASSPASEAIRVREAVPADGERVRDVLRADYAEYADSFPPGLFRAYLANLLGLAVPTEHGRVLIAEHHGEVVGTVTFYPDASAQGLGWPAGWAGVRALGVVPAARSLGVARRLMACCEQLARDSGAEALCLHTAGLMAGAVRLYESLGYRRAPAYDFEAGANPSRPSAQTLTVIAYCREVPA